MFRTSSGDIRHCVTHSLYNKKKFIIFIILVWLNKSSQIFSCLASFRSLIKVLVVSNGVR